MSRSFFRTRSVFLACIAVFVVAPFAEAAAKEPGAGSPQRLRVGLVLGGGGARGAAHVGVLKELERLRVPVDAIAGTSMGAIVGGLYAAGMSAAELEETLATMDWADALSDTPDREDLRFRRKEDEQDYPIDLDLGLERRRMKLPLGLVQGQKLDLILRELTADVSHITDFDRLPVPFRAVASDLENGEPFVMGEGDLALAIRASMSVPGVLAPVRIGDRLLVDGGLVGNLPVDVIRRMDVDVVIAVDVEFPLYRIEELGSAFAIYEQMLTILIHRETLRQIDSLTREDVLIRPELGSYGSADFAGILEAIEPGVAAARAAEERLQPLSVDDETYAAWLDRRAARERTGGTVAFVRVEQNSGLSDDVIESRLEIAPGDPLNRSQLAEVARRLHGTGLFEKVGYRVVEEGGATGVVFDARAKSWGPNYLRFGTSLEDDFEGTTVFDLRARLTRPAVNRYGGEWRADLHVGTEFQVFNELYQPLRFDSRLFVAPYLDFDQSNVNVFDGEDIVARLRITELTAGLDFGTEIGNAGEFRFGAFRGGGEVRVTVGDPLIPSPDFASGGLRALLRFDTRDSPWFARRGVLANIEWQQSLPGFGADSSYDTIEAAVRAVRSRGKSTVGIGVEYATTLSFDGALQDQFTLGGFRRLSGFERDAIRGPHRALARLLFQRRVGSSAGGLFEAPVYFGATLEAGNAWQSRSEISLNDTLLHGSLFIGVDSYIGPLLLGAGAGQNGQSNFYLFIGSLPL